MARSLWSGSLSFGLVNVPVMLVTAVKDLDLHFRQLHEKDGAPIETQRWCPEDDAEIPFEEITRSYECEDGTQVTISEMELEAIEPRRTRTIEIEQFVELAQVDPVLFDHPYFLLPSSDDDGARRAYRLLTEVMADTERAALGRFVMRAKEYLAIVREREGVLTLTTMRFADEVRSPKDVDGASQKTYKPTAKQLDAAVAVIEELSCDWNPTKYKDRYRSRLQSVVQRKRKGQTVKAPDTANEPSPVPDLMAALEQTLAEMSTEAQGERREKRQPQEAR